jgi:hypothetical protein
MGVNSPMYNINLIGTVTMNPPHNEYILINFYNKKQLK